MTGLTRWLGAEQSRLQGEEWWLALAGDGQLPAFLDLGDALRGIEAELLQRHEADQDQRDVADHRGIRPALAGAHAGVLLVSRKTVSTLQRLCLCATTVERSAVMSLVARHSQLP